MMTNYERFMKSITAKELAELLAGEYPVFNNRCKMCIHRNDAFCSGKSCVKGIELWLNSPAKSIGG